MAIPIIASGMPSPSALESRQPSPQRWTLARWLLGEQHGEQGGYITTIWSSAVWLTTRRSRRASGAPPTRNSSGGQHGPCRPDSDTLTSNITPNARTSATAWITHSLVFLCVDAHGASPGRDDAVRRKQSRLG